VLLGEDARDVSFDFVAETDSSNIEIIKNDLFWRYLKRGYLTVSIDSSVRKCDSIFLFFNKGEKYEWGKISFRNDNDLLLNKRKTKKFHKDKILPESISEMHNGILKKYEDNGYPFSSVKLDSVNISEGKVDAVLSINPGMYIRYDSLILKGNSRLKQDFVKSFLGIKKNNPYNESDIVKATERISNLPFIEITHPVIAGFREDFADIYVYVDDAPSNTIDALIGFAPKNEENQSGIVVTGKINLKLQNSLGNGELIGLNWERPDNLSQNLDINIEWPYIFNTALGPDIEFNLDKYDTSWLALNFIGGVNFYLTGGNYFSFGYETYNSYPLISEPVTDISDVSRSLYNVGGHFRNISNPLNPVSGYYLNAVVGVGNRESENNLGEKEKNSLVTVSFKAGLHYNFIGKNIISVLNSTAFMSFSGQGNKAYSENELYRFGGFGSLRGFDEEALFANGFTLLSTEYKYMLGKLSSIFLFYDIAYYEKYTEEVYVSDTPMGFGLGGKVGAGNGVFTISYALGREFNNPVDFRSAKVHVGFVSRF
jgi:outer membrane protein assembly factor BamA